MQKQRYSETSGFIYWRFLLNTLSRYDTKCKVKSIRRKLRRLGLEKIAKIEKVSINELNKAEKLQEKSIDELKAIARLRRI